MVSIGLELGGPSKAESMLKARGVGFILKYMDVRYKRPVIYPDTVRYSFLVLPHQFSLARPHTLIVHAQLLIAHKPSISSSRTEINPHAAAYSYAQSAIVAESNSIIVWYDYNTLKKCDPGAEAWAVVKGRIRE